MNTQSSFVGALLCTVVLLLAAGGCDSGAPEPTTSSSSSDMTTSAVATRSPSPSASPTPTDDRGRAVAAVIAYWTAIDAASSDPGIKLETLAKVARGQALDQTRFS